MSIDIKLHKKDLPDDFKVSNTIAIDCEMGGLNINRDPLFLVQISSGNLDAHIVQLNRENYKAPKLLSILEDNKVKKILLPDLLYHRRVHGGNISICSDSSDYKDYFSAIRAMRRQRGE